MAIYRGAGGSGQSNNQALINDITNLSIEVQDNADSASTSATQASTSASQAATSATSASTSATNAQTSETNAASSASSASASATSASNSASQSATSATESANSATASATSASESATSASQAATSATNAATSESNAATSASNAATSASNASTSATSASNSASSASTSATSASTSATQAQTSATQAAQSASDAEDSYDSFTEKYTVSATAPTSPVEGMLWWDSTNDAMKVYDGNSFVLAGSAVNGTAVREVFTATAGQTTFAIEYDVGFVDVFLNGVKLVNTTDFTATNGTSVVLTSGASEGDSVDIIAYGAFEVADTYTQAQADARFIQASDVTTQLTVIGRATNTEVVVSNGSITVEGRNANIIIGVA